MTWFSGLEEICQPDVPLRDHTWYGLGGPARWLCTPRDEDQLAELLRRCGMQNVPWRILGQGANIVVRDEGVEGAVIKLAGPPWDTIAFDRPRVYAGGGADFTKVVRQTVDRGLAGLEHLAGIPGTVGGVIRMNAGGRHGHVGQCIQDVRVMTPDGTRQTRTAAQMAFGYRTSKLDGGVVLGATFALQPADPQATLDRFRRIWHEKAESQPAVSARSAGCIFKNPPGQAAGALLDQAGLKRRRCGGAEISPKHANFIVAHPGATAQNVLDLIALAREAVHNRTGIALELEVEVW